LSNIVLLRPSRPPSVSVKASRVAAPACSDHLALALAAGFTELSIPQLTDGCSLAAALLPSDSNALAEVAGRHGPDTLQTAIRSVVSAKLHGRKPLNSNKAGQHKQ
jgi:hypothetical protein